MEPITLSTPKKLSGPAQADVIRRHPSVRVAQALAIGIGGTVFGVFTILIPVAHFVTTWAIPLVSIFVAVHVFKMGPFLQRILGDCPACNKSIDSEKAGTLASDLWIRCPHCNEALHPELSLLSEE